MRRENSKTSEQVQRNPPCPGNPLLIDSAAAGCDLHEYVRRESPQSEAQTVNLHGRSTRQIHKANPQGRSTGQIHTPDPVREPGCLFVRQACGGHKCPYKRGTSSSSGTGIPLECSPRLHGMAHHIRQRSLACTSMYTLVYNVQNFIAVCFQAPRRSETLRFPFDSHSIV